MLRHAMRAALRTGRALPPCARTLPPPQLASSWLLCRCDARASAVVHTAATPTAAAQLAQQQRCCNTAVRTAGALASHAARAAAIAAPSAAHHAACAHGRSLIIAAASSSQRGGGDNGNGNDVAPSPADSQPGAAADEGAEEEEEEEGEDDIFCCPWGWCEGDAAAHELLCLTSKARFGVSWMHTRTRPQLWLQGDCDPWVRDAATGHATALEDTPVPPPPRVREHGLDGLLPHELRLLDEEDFKTGSDEEEK
jgi:hypothetical protein